MSYLKRLLIHHEGLSLTPYRCTGNKWTIGVGHNFEDNPFTTEEMLEILHKGFTHEVAMLILDNDIHRTQEDLTTVFTWYQSLDRVRRDVITNMAFNLGVPRLMGFRRMVAAIRQKDYEGASAEMLDSKWAKQVGQRAEDLAHMMKTGSYDAVRDIVVLA